VRVGYLDGLFVIFQWLLEPIIPDTTRWFEELDQFNSEPFLPRGRRQPVTPKRKIF